MSATKTLPCASTTMPEPGCASALNDMRAQRTMSSNGFV
jgi:hypothetical protein